MYMYMHIWALGLEHTMKTIGFCARGLLKHNENHWFLRPGLLKHNENQWFLCPGFLKHNENHWFLRPGLLKHNENQWFLRLGLLQHNENQWFLRPGLLKRREIQWFLRPGIYVYIYMYMCIYIYIYVITSCVQCVMYVHQAGRFGGSTWAYMVLQKMHSHAPRYICIYIYICICVYIYIGKRSSHEIAHRTSTAATGVAHAVPSAAAASALAPWLPAGWRPEATEAWRYVESSSSSNWSVAKPCRRSRWGAAGGGKPSNSSGPCSRSRWPGVCGARVAAERARVWSAPVCSLPEQPYMFEASVSCADHAATRRIADP